MSAGQYGHAVGCTRRGLQWRKVGAHELAVGEPASVHVPDLLQRA